MDIKRVKKELVVFGNAIRGAKDEEFKAALDECAEAIAKTIHEEIQKGLDDLGLALQKEIYGKIAKVFGRGVRDMK